MANRLVSGHGVAELFRDRGADVEADGVHQLDRPHRHAEGDRGGIDQLGALAALDPLHRAQHVGHQHAVDEEARRRLHDHRALADGERERGALRDLVVGVEGRADDLDERQLRDRVEEVEADQPRGIGEALGDALELDRGGVGRKDRAGLELLLGGRRRSCA